MATKNILGTYGRSGLIKRDSSKRCGLRLTAEAQSWIGSQDPDYLIAVLHANTKFVGELLDCLADRMTHEQLREIASNDFALGWKTLDQVRRRTNWLRAAGYLELWSNLELVITAKGRTALERLQTSTPGDLPINQSDDPAVVPIAPDGIAQALAGMSQEKLTERRRAISYIPGGEEIATTVANLVSAIDPSATKQEFGKYCEEAFSISGSSADSALQTLRSAGLIEQTGPYSFSPSSVAVEWIESRDPVDLIRILHCHFIGLGETLYAITQVDGSGKISKFLTDKFAIQQLPVGEVARRVKLLHSARLIDQVTQFTYRINSLGRALLEELPLLAPSDASSSTQASNESSNQLGATSDESDTNHIDEAESIAGEIVDAAYDATRHRRLEAAVATAFRYVGLSAQHLGYSDRTDVLLTAWLAPGQKRTMIVDAKAASAGVVEENRVNFDKLELHREKHSADKIVVVGTDFAARVQEYAKNRSVTLLRTADLASWVRRHAEVPISTETIVALLDGSDSKSLRRSWETASQRRNVFAGVIQQLWQSANNESDIRMSGGALSARDLWISLRGEYPDAQLADIESTLQLLASDLIGCTKKMRDGGYVMLDPPALIAHKLRSLISVIEPVWAFSEDQASQEELPPFSQFDVSQLDDVRDKGNSDEIDPTVVRAWARSQGIDVRDRGRLPSSLVRRYREENKTK